MDSTEDGWDQDGGPGGHDPDFGGGQVAAWAVVDAKALGAGRLADVLSPVLVPGNDRAKAEQS
jgi:hypothetical protein